MEAHRQIASASVTRNDAIEDLFTLSSTLFNDQSSFFTFSFTLFNDGASRCKVASTRGSLYTYTE